MSRPFGASRKAVGLEGWDAFHPAHLPLPRSIGPYTVVRTSALVTSDDRVNIIGCFAENRSVGNTSVWTNYGMLRSINSALPLSDPNNALVSSVPFPGASAVAGSGLSAVPAAISVQVMNPNPLQTTEGIVAAAVCPTQLDLRGRTETWAEFGSEFISFMRPRLMSAGKLSLRGVQMDSYPLNMSALADFRPVSNASGDITFTWDAGSTTHPLGFAPLVVINQASTETPPLELNFLITIEWRVRFDIGNPAVASHRHHGVSTDQHWDTMLRAAANMGNGVRDIVERVANTGAAVVDAVGRGAQAYRAARSAMALMD